MSRRSVLNIVRQFLWPVDLGGRIGRVLGALSILVLMRDGLHYSFGRLLALLVHLYANLAGIMLGWAHPYLQALLERVQGYLWWNVALYPHWKYVFILMGVYFFRDSATDFAAGIKVTGTFRLVWGGIVALCTAVVVGMIPLHSNNIFGDFLIAGIPVVGIYLYDVGDSIWGSTFLRKRWAQMHHQPVQTWWQDFHTDWFSDSIRTVIALALACLLFWWPPVRGSSSPGLLVLALLLGLFAFYWLWLGASYVRDTRNEGETWLNAFLRSGEVELGGAMLGVFFWNGLFLLADSTASRLIG